jgi:hypothetical protein
MLKNILTFFHQLYDFQLKFLEISGKGKMFVFPKGASGTSIWDRAVTQYLSNKYDGPTYA